MWFAEKATLEYYELSKEEFENPYNSYAKMAHRGEAFTSDGIREAQEQLFFHCLAEIKRHTQCAMNIADDLNIKFPSDNTNYNLND